MTQQPPAPDGAENEAGGTTAAPAEKTDLATLPADVREYIESLRSEAKNNRLEKTRAEKARQQEETARLEADQKWQQVAEKYKQQLDALSPLAEQLAAMKETIAATVEARIAQLPKDRRGLVPEYDDPAKTLAWLERNAATLSLPAVPNTGAGQQGDHAGAAAARLTPEELALAKQARMTPEQFALYKVRKKPEGAT